MPIRNQIEAIVQTMLVIPPVEPSTDYTAPGFRYGTSKELNVLADDANFPCVFLYALQPIDAAPGVNGSVNNSISILLAFLFKTEFDQYSADDEVNVNEAWKWANIFIAKASVYREGSGRYFRIKAGERSQIKPFYNKSEFDVNTSGVTLSITLNTMYDEKLISY
jgi:hypothetical protein